MRKGAITMTTIAKYKVKFGILENLMNHLMMKPKFNKTPANAL